MGKTVKVACRVPNGVLIRLQKDGPDDGTGKPFVAHDGPAIRLAGPSSIHTGAGDPFGSTLEPGYTEVDAEWFARWLDQHKLDPMVTQGFIFEAPPEPEENPTT